MRNLILATAALLVLASGAAGQTQPDQARPAGIPVTIVTSPDEAKRQTDLEAKADAHDKADLDAQQRAADAADRSANATVSQILPSRLQALFAFVGTIGLIVTIFYSHRTYRLSALTAQRQLRAYMLLDSDGVFAEGPYLESGTEPRGMLRFKNYGQTPAFDFVSSISTASSPWPLPDDVNLEIAPENSNPHVIGPGGHCFKGFGYDGGGQVIPTTDFHAINQGMVRFILFGTAKYRDIFGEVHRTEFCLSIHKPPNSTGLMIGRAPRHNSAD